MNVNVENEQMGKVLPTSLKLEFVGLECLLKKNALNLYLIMLVSFLN